MATRGRSSTAAPPGMMRGLCHGCKAVLEFGDQGGLVKCYNCPKINNFPGKSATSAPKSPRPSTEKSSSHTSKLSAEKAEKKSHSPSPKPPALKPGPPPKEKKSPSANPPSPTPPRHEEHKPAKPKTKIDHLKLEKPGHKEHSTSPPASSDPGALTIRTAKRKADADAKLDDIIFGGSPVAKPRTKTVEPEPELFPEPKHTAPTQPKSSPKQPRAVGSPETRPGPRKGSPAAGRSQPVSGDRTYWDIRKAFLQAMAKFRANPDQGVALDIVNDFFEEGGPNFFPRLRKYNQVVLKALRKKDFKPILDIGAYIKDYPVEGMLSINGKTRFLLLNAGDQTLEIYPNEKKGKLIQAVDMLDAMRVSVSPKEGLVLHFKARDATISGFPNAVAQGSWHHTLNEFIKELKMPGTLRFKSSKEPKLDPSYQLADADDGDDIVVFLDDPSDSGPSGTSGYTKQGKKLFEVGDEANIQYAPIEQKKRRFQLFIDRVEAIRRTDDLDDALEIFNEFIEAGAPNEIPEIQHMGAEINMGLRKANYEGLYKAQKLLHNLLEEEYAKQAKDRAKALQKEQKELDPHATELVWTGAALSSALPPHKLPPKQIKRIDLSSNRFTTLPNVLPYENLEVLVMTGNIVAQLPPQINKLNSLVELQLNGNQLKSLPKQIGGLPNLEFLWLNNNQITELPKEIGALPRLEELHISGNLLRTLPDTIALPPLLTLDVSYCQLDSLQEPFCWSTRLIELNLSHNRLARLPDSFGRMSRLGMLNISGNQLTDLPLSIGHCVGLGKPGAFDISLNSITDSAMMKKSAIGCDHLVDYLEKRMAMKNNPELPWVAYPTLGTAPPPDRPPQLQRRNSSGPPPQASALEPVKPVKVVKPVVTVPVIAEDDPKIVALRNWVLTTAGEIRTVLQQIKSSLAGSHSDAAVMPFARTVSLGKKELDSFLPALPNGIPAPPGTPARDLQSVAIFTLKVIELTLQEICRICNTGAKTEQIIVFVKGMKALKAALE